MLTFGQALRLERDLAGMSQTELAKRLGLARSTVSSYESGFRTPDLATLEKIAAVLKIDLSRLCSRRIEDHQEKKPIYPPGTIVIDEDSDHHELIMAYGKAPQSTKDAISILLGLKKRR